MAAELTALHQKKDWKGVVAMEKEALMFAHDMQDGGELSLAGQVFGVLGTARHNLGFYERAIELYKEGKTISTAAGERQEVGAA